MEELKEQGQQSFRALAANLVRQQSAITENSAYCDFTFAAPLSLEIYVTLSAFRAAVQSFSLQTS